MTAPVITLYTFATPNGHKASIMLEELGLSYTVHKLDLAGGENKTPEYLRVSPLGKVPALVEAMGDGPPLRIFGSGAILMHYAERSGRLMPTEPQARAEALSWLALGISDLGPAAVDMYRFSVRAPEKIPYAIDLFKGDLVRCYTALEERLTGSEFLAGAYSIADISCYPFIAVAATSGGASLLERFPAIKRWHDTVGARPAVRRGMAVPE